MKSGSTVSITVSSYFAARKADTRRGDGLPHLTDSVADQDARQLAQRTLAIKINPTIGKYPNFSSIKDHLKPTDRFSAEAVKQHHIYPITQKHQQASAWPCVKF